MTFGPIDLIALEFDGNNFNREVIAENGDKVSHATDEGGMREAYDMWKRMMSQ